MPFTAKDEEFRHEARAFIEQNLPQDVRDKVLSGQEVHKEDYMRWYTGVSGERLVSAELARGAWRR